MVYLDHAATTPMLPEVATAVADVMVIGGNPSSLHASGRRARRRVEEARESIAADLAAHPTEVLFTSGGTESDNAAISGLFFARREADLRRRRILVSAAEHHAVLDTVESLAARSGAEITWLETDSVGRVQPEAVADAIAGDPDSVALATVMWANNEVGTVNDIGAIAQVCQEYGIPLHSDAVQAAPILPVQFAASGAAALAIAGHKLGGPGGTGVLVLGREAKAVPLMHGGGQERGVRSGTLNQAGIVGLAVALRQTVIERAERTERYRRLAGRLRAGILAAVPSAVPNGDPGDQQIAGGPSRLPGNVHLRFPGCESDTLLMLLDAAGIECSAGSACSAGVARASHVMLAMGLTEPQARSAVRLSLGHNSTDTDVEAAIAVIGEVAHRAQAAGRARGIEVKA